MPSNGLLKLGSNSSDTIRKYFRKAGILTENFQVVQSLRISEENDPFSDIDESNKEENGMEVTDPELTELISKLQGKDDACGVSD